MTSVVRLPVELTRPTERTTILARTSIFYAGSFQAARRLAVMVVNKNGDHLAFFDVSVSAFPSAFYSSLNGVLFGASSELFTRWLMHRFDAALTTRSCTFTAIFNRFRF